MKPSPPRYPGGSYCCASSCFQGIRTFKGIQTFFSVPFLGCNPTCMVFSWSKLSENICFFFCLPSVHETSKSDINQFNDFPSKKAPFIEAFPQAKGIWWYLVVWILMDHDGSWRSLAWTWPDSYGHFAVPASPRRFADLPWPSMAIHGSWLMRSYPHVVVAEQPAGIIGYTLWSSNMAVENPSLITYRGGIF